MIQSPGAYHFVDYQKLGIPFEICLNVFQVLCLYYIDYPYVTIPIALLFLMFCIVVDHVVVEKRRVSSLTVFHPIVLMHVVKDFALGLVPQLPPRKTEPVEGQAPQGSFAWLKSKANMKSKQEFSDPADNGAAGPQSESRV
jgi:hypothetical protein